MIGVGGSSKDSLKELRTTPTMTYCATANRQPTAQDGTFLHVALNELVRDNRLRRRVTSSRSTKSVPD